MFNIDYRNPKPIYEQLTEQIEDFAMKGILKQDEQLPSVRQLAMELSINPNTIQKAYTNLEKMGITYSVKGRGSFIAPISKKMIDDKIFIIKSDIKNLVKEAKSLGVENDTIFKWIKEGDD